MPDDLLKRVRVRCAESGERQNAFVERALESALGERPSVGHSASPREVAGSTPVTPAPSRASAPKLPAGVKTARELAMEKQAALNKAKGS